MFVLYWYAWIKVNVSIIFSRLFTFVFSVLNFVFLTTLPSVLIKSRARFRLNLHSIVAWMLRNDWAVLWVLICTVHLTVYYYNVTYVFQSESTLSSCLNVKELLARNRRDIWSLSDSNRIRTHNHLVHTRTFNHLAKLSK